MKITHRPWVNKYTFSLDVHECTSLFVPYSYRGPNDTMLARLYDITLLVFTRSVK